MEDNHSEEYLDNFYNKRVPEEEITGKLWMNVENRSYWSGVRIYCYSCQTSWHPLNPNCFNCGKPGQKEHPDVSGYSSEYHI